MTIASDNQVVQETPGSPPWAQSSIEWTSVGKFFAIAAHLALLLVFMRLFQIEPGSGIQRILVLLFAGFVVHAALPLGYRLPFFLLLSFAAIGLVIGIIPAAAVACVGFTLIAIAHLPFRLSIRVALILLVAAILAAVRSGWSPIIEIGKFSPLAMPVIGSMFMFRLIVYLHDLRLEERTKKKSPGAFPPTSIWARLAYFFLLPNVCFLLFPVVDYRLYRRTYYDTDANDIYQRGVSWIALGLVYLLAYRFVYHYLAIAPDQVNNVGALAEFMVTTYLVVLRLVGQFHIAVGILCLFGFNLPPANRFLFLASSFTDFWRRVRIDWKDFILKVVYYPLYLPLQRRMGVLMALTLATVVAFAATWLLHSVQWFWLRGDFLLSSADVVFWAVFGACVLANSVIEARAKRKSTAHVTPTSAAIHASKIVGMFIFLSILWSYWTSPSASDWLTLVSAARNGEWRDYAALVAGIAVIVAALSAAQLMGLLGSGKAAVAAVPAQKPVSIAWQLGSAGAFALLIIAHLVDARSDSRSSLQQFVSTMSSTRLNAADQATLTRGYYETLLDVGSSSVARLGGEGAGQIQQLNAAEGAASTGTAATGNTNSAAGAPLPAPEPITRMDFVTREKTLLAYGLKPSYSGTYRGASFTTNRWGMRDKEYALTPTPGTYRLALVGGSYEMASGVAAEDGFEAKLEDRLNRDVSNNRRYEILNFSVGGYDVMQAALVTEQKVFRFSPNAVALGLEALASERVLDHLVPLVRVQKELKVPYISQKFAQAGVDSSMSRTELRAKLRSVAPDIIRWSLSRIANACRAHGVPAFVLVIPRTQPDRSDASELAQLTTWARSAGFTIVDVTDAFRELPADSIWISSLDQHPNVRGHSLIADALYRQLLRNDQWKATFGSSRNNH